MQRILLKRTGRSFRRNLPRYTALMLMIILSLFAVVSTTVSTETVITEGQRLAEEDRVEDGQFTVFAPLSEGEEASLRDEGITLERMFSTDYEGEDSSCIRIFPERRDIDLLRLNTGRAPAADDEIVLERRYAEVHGIAAGDTVKAGNDALTVTGTGTVPDYQGPFRTLSGGAVDSSAFGPAFMTDEGYEALTDRQKGIKTEEYLYAYRLNGKMTHQQLEDEVRDLPLREDTVSDPYFKDYFDETAGMEEDIDTAMDDMTDGLEDLTWGLNRLVNAGQSMDLPAAYSDGVRDARNGSAEIRDGFREFRDDSEELVDETFSSVETGNLQTFTRASDNPRIGCAVDDQMINRSTALMAGIIVMILFAYIIAVFVSHEIERDSTVIGTLYALGVTRRDLTLHYLQLPVITTFAGGVIGLLAGSSGPAFDSMTASVMNYFSMPDIERIYPAGVIIYALAVPAAIAAAVNFIVIWRKLGRPALSMMRNEEKKRKVRAVKLDRLAFTGRFRIRQMMRESRSALTVVLGIFIAYLLLMLGLNCLTHTGTVADRSRTDIAFDYMYTLKYPDEEVPAGGEAVCGMTGSMNFMGYSMDVQLMGMEEDDPYFHNDFTSKGSEVTVSDALATKFGLEEGDTFTVEDEGEGRFLAFRVKDITDYAPGFMVFADIDYMRDIMDASGDYYNIVLSDEELDIPAGRLYSTLTSDDIVSGSGIFLTMMEPMIYMMLFCSAGVFIFVLYLMMKVMVDRSSKGISLFRIFGYRPGEIRKLFLDGNFFIVAAGSALLLPAAKKIMDILYPSMSADVASGIYLDFPWYIYAVIYAVTIILYILIDVVLMRRIGRISPAVILAERE